MLQKLLTGLCWYGMMRGLIVQLLIFLFLQGSTELDVSWKVACGANVAYDQFPSQNQVCDYYH